MHRLFEQDPGGDGSFADAADPEPLLELLSELESEVRDEQNDGDGELSHGKKKRPKEHDDSDDDDSIFIKLPLPGEIRKIGNAVYCGEQKTGQIQYLVHWEPAAIAVNCSFHGSNCFVTCPLIGCDEDALIRWVGEAPCFVSADDHGKQVPKNCYHRRNPPRS